MSTEKAIELLKELAPLLTSYALRVFGVLLLIWLAFRVAAWVQRRVVKALAARKFDETLSLFFATLARWIIILGTVLGCLSAFGIETTSFAAVIGAAGLAIGLGFQGTLASFAAGVMLLVFRPFKVGDVVSTAGQIGLVKEIGLFTTTLVTADNRQIIIPNSEVSSKIIENITAHDMRRVDIDVGVAYDADIDETRAVLDRAASDVPGRDDEKGHVVFLKGLGASSVDWQVRVWCKADEYWDVWQATIRAVKISLDDAGIGIPFPQMDVHVQGTAKKAG